jgi:hypothetical protein
MLTSNPPNLPPNYEIFLKKFFGKSSKAKAILAPQTFQKKILGFQKDFRKKGKKEAGQKSPRNHWYSVEIPFVRLL